MCVDSARITRPSNIRHEYVCVYASVLVLFVICLARGNRSAANAPISHAARTYATRVRQKELPELDLL